MPVIYNNPQQRNKKKEESDHRRRCSVTPSIHQSIPSNLLSTLVSCNSVFCTRRRKKKGGVSLPRSFFCPFVTVEQSPRTLRIFLPSLLLLLASAQMLARAPPRVQKGKLCFFLVSPPGGVPIVGRCTSGPEEEFRRVRASCLWGKVAFAVILRRRRRRGHPAWIRRTTSPHGRRHFFFTA